MNTFFEKVGLLFRDKTLVRRVIFTLIILVVFRLLAAIPIPGVDEAALQRLFSGSTFLGLLNIFSGGGLSNLSIVMLAVGPYITASIIMQLLTMMSPRLKAMYQEEGQLGRKKFMMYSRLLTVPLGLVQGFSFLLLLQRQGVIATLNPFEFAVNVLVITAGSMLLTWLGELISEFGIGNGLSLIIFAGIIAGLPQVVSQWLYTYDPSQIPIYLAFAAAAALVILGVVIITEAERPIPVTYAKRVRGMKVYGGLSTYIPLRLNQAGVIPIIFALSILLLPQMLFQFLSTVSQPFIQSASKVVLSVLANSWYHAILYFLLVFIFTYFYTAVTFDPDSMATNLQKNGAFIPGVRPGVTTAQFVSRILTRITLFGALFLGIIAVLPLVMQSITGNASLAVGGTALLIVVSVILDLFKKVDAQVSMREY
jgi:preprotein translocase subunit SecY